MARTCDKQESTAFISTVDVGLPVAIAGYYRSGGVGSTEWGRRDLSTSALAPAPTDKENEWRDAYNCVQLNEPIIQG